MSIYLNNVDTEGFIFLFVCDSTEPEWNLVLDKKGCAAIHWAAYFGRKNYLDALILCGANKTALNCDKQTALMQTVMGTNCFELSVFSPILQTLETTVCLVDANGRTVLHHIALTAGSKSGICAAEYYMGIFEGFFDGKMEKEFVDRQDLNGDNALHIACRFESEAIAKSLLRIGASNCVLNRDGKLAENVVPVTSFHVFSNLLHSEKVGLKELQKPQNKVLIALSVIGTREILQINHQMETNQISQKTKIVQEELKSAMAQVQNVKPELEKELSKNELLKQMKQRLHELETIRDLHCAPAKGPVSPPPHAPVRTSGLATLQRELSAKLARSDRELLKR
ncbi:transcriptional regulator swi6 [Nowakowskiella sp. JEL0407]|nr:transcriptional regulator swi6 [Nowakowskiella sp. JEL0407]